MYRSILTGSMCVCVCVFVYITVIFLHPAAPNTLFMMAHHQWHTEQRIFFLWIHLTIDWFRFILLLNFTKMGWFFVSMYFAYTNKKLFSTYILIKLCHRAYAFLLSHTHDDIFFFWVGVFFSICWSVKC